jgi:hypothetical protein
LAAIGSERKKHGVRKWHGFGEAAGSNPRSWLIASVAGQED